jgi:hypothetical protein
MGRSPDGRNRSNCMPGLVVGYFCQRYHRVIGLLLRTHLRGPAFAPNGHNTAPSDRSTRRVYRLAIWRSLRSCVVEDKITLRVQPLKPTTAARCPPGNCSKLQDAPALRAGPATASTVSFWRFMMRPQGCECAQPSRRSRWRTTRNAAPGCPRMQTDLVLFLEKRERLMSRETT